MMAGLAVVGHVLLDDFLVRLAQHRSSPRIADEFRVPLNHAMPLAGLRDLYLPRRRELEPFLGAGFGFLLGHFAILLMRLAMHLAAAVAAGVPLRRLKGPLIEPLF
jgi:hypothetical protein